MLTYVSDWNTIKPRHIDDVSHTPDD